MVDLSPVTHTAVLWWSPQWFAHPRNTDSRIAPLRAASSLRGSRAASPQVFDGCPGPMLLHACPPHRHPFRITSERRSWLSIMAVLDCISRPVPSFSALRLQRTWRVSHVSFAYRAGLLRFSDGWRATSGFPSGCAVASGPHQMLAAPKLPVFSCCCSTRGPDLFGQ